MPIAVGGQHQLGTVNSRERGALIGRERLVLQHVLRRLEEAREEILARVETRQKALDLTRVQGTPP